jgi:hypothetical protein
MPAEAERSLYNRLGVVVRRFVRWWRRLDARINRPQPEGRAPLWTWLAPDGYPWFFPAVAAVLVAAMALGPTLETRPANLALLALGLGLLLIQQILAARSVRLREYLLAGQLAILALLAVLILVLASPETFGTPRALPRLHVGVALVFALVIALGVIWTIAGTLFRSGTNNTLDQSLRFVELFPPQSRYDFMGRGPIAALLSALVIAPARYPVQLLLPGSLLVLFLPDQWLWTAFLLATAAALFAIFLGILFERLMEILYTIGRLFFVGPQYLLSLLVIMVAILRLLDVHYITYLFTPGSGTGTVTIMVYVALAYAVAWHYAFWSDHFVARRVICLLAPGKPAVTPLAIPYPFDGDSRLSLVENAGRSIALHGAGRLKIEGRYEPGAEASGRALQFQTPADLLARLRAHIEHSPRDAVPSPDPLPDIRNLQRAAFVYPAITASLALLLIGGATWATFSRAIQPPALAIQPTAAAERDLATLLLDGSGATGACPPPVPGAPRIALAASGGGTRAALYTASLLRGLEAQGRICDVVLVSGVSGGSAALAHFALNEDRLRRSGGTDHEAWRTFSETMAAPFIEYVIDGASDLRIALGRWRWQDSACTEPVRGTDSVAGWLPARTRLGNILAESFVCKMGAGGMGEAPFGLMLNTALLGEFDMSASDCGAGARTLAEHATRCRGGWDDAGAGGRLVLTNLATPLPEPEGGMRMVTLNDRGISIARAAALSANFPPVFPDAAIDVQPAGGTPGRRYWVTDGGAVENRGTVTMYLAIREALKDITPGTCLAPLHIVVADVSGLAGGYAESFGVGAVRGAGGQLGLALEQELLEDIRAAYARLGGTIVVHEIAMPPVLRRGGIGTHWLLPGRLTFTEPLQGSDSVTLSAADVKRLVLDLHDVNDDGDFDNPEGAELVRAWVRLAPARTHHASWRELLDALAAPAPCRPDR